MQRIHKKNLAVIGNGSVVRQFVETLVALDKQAEFNPVIFDKPHLSNPSGNHVDYAGKAVTFFKNTQKPMDVLVLTTNAPSPLPASPPPELDDNNRKGVFIYRTPTDLEEVKKYAMNAKRAIVVGGGLAGIEAAKFCVDMGLRTTILESSKQLMQGQLNQRGTEILENLVSEYGISVRTRAVIKCLRGNRQLSCVRLIGDYLLPTDLVIMTPTHAPKTKQAYRSKRPVTPMPKHTQPERYTGTVAMS